MKKVISLFLASMMLVSLLMGCSANNDETDSTGQTSNNTENTGTGDAADSSTDEPVHIVIYTYALGQAVEQPSTEEELSKVQNYVADEIGVFPEVIIAPQGSEIEKLNTLLASGEQIDMFGGDWASYYSENIIIPLNDLIENFGQDVKAAWSEESWNAMMDSEGNIWGTPRSTPTTPYPLFIRQDWLAEYNLEMPTDFESLEEVLQTFAENDPAGNGQTIPLLTDTVANLSNVLSAGFTGVGYGARWLDPSDNMLKPMVYNDDYKEFIEAMADWYSKGYIHREAFGQPDVRDLIKANKVGINATWYSNMTFSQPILQQNYPDAVYEIAQITGSSGTLSETVANSGRGANMITTMCENPEAAMKFANWAFEDTYNFLVLKDGIEDEHWQMIDEELLINEMVDPDNIAYRGELAYIPLGMAIEQRLNTQNFEQAVHYEYIRNKNLAFDRALKSDEFGVIYEAAILEEEIPMQTDINTIIEQELVAFITGTRPLTEWDDFLAQLDGAGVDTYIEVYTREYNRLK